MPGQQEGKYQAVYFDLQDKAAWPLPRLLAELGRTIADSLGWPTSTPSVVGTEAFRLWIKQRLGGFDDGQTLVLLFDEFDVLADPQTGSAAKDFFPNLRDLLSRNSARLQFVFVLGRNINDLSSLALSVFKGVDSKRVSLLNQADTAKLVRLSGRDFPGLAAGIFFRPPLAARPSSRRLTSAWVGLAPWRHPLLQRKRHDLP